MKQIIVNYAIAYYIIICFCLQSDEMKDILTCMSKIERIREIGLPKIDYAISRNITEGQEYFNFSTFDKFPSKLWQPRLLGQTTLAVYVARMEIVNKREVNEPPKVFHFDLTPLQSFHVRLPEFHVSMGENVTYNALRRYLKEDLEDEQQARVFYESLTPRQHDAINDFNVNAPENPVFEEITA